MKKINIVTYCVATSYGSVLQAYGLKQTLKSIGYESRILETESFPSESYKVKLNGSITLKNLLMYLSEKLLLKQTRKRLADVQEFIDKNMDIDYYPDYEKLTNIFHNDDIFLAGSDQILHPVKLLPAFFLDFAPKKAKKVTYATSMGVLDVPEDKSETFGKLINNFDVISVREKEMIPVLKNYTNKPMTVNIDPVFLYGCDNWRKIMRPYSIKKPYVVVYSIYWNSKLNSELKKLHHDTGFDIVVISGSYRNMYADRWIFDAGLEEFLWLIDNAEAVVSSSFHGVAMGLCFNKKVAAVINPSAPSRIADLLDTLGYSNIGISQIKDNLQVDFKTVNQRIKEERQKGIEYLKTVLNN